MALVFENKRNVTICAGVGGSGKSTFAIRYLVNAPLTARFCFDAEGEFSQRLKIPGAGDLYELGLWLCRGWVIFDPHVAFPGQLPAAFDWFCQWAFDVSSRMPGQKCLVVDEVWKYCSPQQIPAGLALVCQTGRKRGLGLMVNTQLPNKLNGSLLNECSEMVCFRLQFSKALEIAQDFGLSSEELAALPDLAFVSRSDRGSELRGKLRL